jgi:hypothetical protein
MVAVWLIGLFRGPGLCKIVCPNRLSGRRWMDVDGMRGGPTDDRETIICVLRPSPRVRRCCGEQQQTVSGDER